MYTQFAQRRFVVAFAASVLVHAWLANVTGGGRIVVTARTTEDTPLSVALERRVEVAADSNAEAAPVYADAAPALASSRVRAAPRIERKDASKSEAIASPAPESTQGVADPTYYGARELDVLPTLAAPVDLRALASATGTLQLLLLISDTGVVEEASVTGTLSAMTIADEARRVFLTARFIPAQRAGRRVKSRVTIEVAFDRER